MFGKWGRSHTPVVFWDFRASPTLRVHLLYPVSRFRDEQTESRLRVSKNVTPWATIKTRYKWKHSLSTFPWRF